jgi:hypothetical protein
VHVARAAAHLRRYLDESVRAGTSNNAEMSS